MKYKFNKFKNKQIKNMYVDIVVLIKINQLVIKHKPKNL